MMGFLPKVKVAEKKILEEKDAIVWMKFDIKKDKQIRIDFF